MGPDATMGTLFFVGVAGQPVLLSCECGVGSLHAVRLFVQQHAPPGSCFLSWRFKPPPALTVSHFWELLRSKGGCVCAGRACLLVLLLCTLRYSLLASTLQPATNNHMPQPSCALHRPGV